MFKRNSVKIRLVAVALLVLSCAVFFQNCGMQVRFGTPEGKLVSKAASTGEINDLVNGESTDSNNLGDGDGTEILVVSTPIQGGADSRPSPAPTAVSARPSPGQESDAGAGKGGELKYVCVLNGPGKSLLLGFIDEKLIGQNSTPDTVCTTKYACEEIASKEFDVKQALYRANCEANKHVVKMTEETMEALVVRQQ